MNKKYIRQQIIDTDNSEINDESHRLLNNIHNKLDNSPALNGGFDKLLYKIDGIEKCQFQIVEKVDKIHEAIYHPDDGLFSRIAYNKATQVESMIKVEKHVHVLNDWKTSAELSDKASEKEIEHLQLKLQKLETNIENIQKLQSVVLASGKWLGVAIGGGLITAALRVFFNGVKMLP
jgi:hypothetical protein